VKKNPPLLGFGAHPPPTPWGPSGAPPSPRGLAPSVQHFWGVFFVLFFWVQGAFCTVQGGRGGAFFGVPPNFLTPAKCPPSGVWAKQIYKKSVVVGVRLCVPCARSKTKSKKKQQFLCVGKEGARHTNSVLPQWSLPVLECSNPNKRGPKKKKTLLVLVVLVGGGGVSPVVPGCGWPPREFFFFFFWGENGWGVGEGFFYVTQCPPTSLANKPGFVSAPRLPFFWDFVFRGKCLFPP